MSIVSLFCEIDDFFLTLMKSQVEYRLEEEIKPLETRRRPRSLHPSEIMMLLINFHQGPLSDLQGLLSTPCLRLSPLGVSHPRQLYSLC